MRETFTPRTRLRQIFSREFLSLSVIAPPYGAFARGVFPCGLCQPRIGASTNRCPLCRARNNGHYSEYLIMPSEGRFCRRARDYSLIELRIIIDFLRRPRVCHPGDSDRLPHARVRSLQVPVPSISDWHGDTLGRY